MGQHTDIEWCDSTVNPTTGCDGCELWMTLPGVRRKGGPCYAGNFHESRLAKSLPALYAPDFTEVRLASGRMAKAAAWPDLTGKARPGKPWLDGLPRIIFLGDMGDVMSKAVSFDYLLSEVVEVVASKAGRRHVWMMLTKQAARLAAFAAWLRDRGVEWPDNLWAGVSVTRQATARRIDHLLSVPAAVRFVSYEPAREFIDFSPYLDRGYESGGSEGWVPEPSVHLIIVGGESDQGRYTAHPFNVGWARSTIRECRSAGASCFVKQFGSAPYFVVYNENSTTDPGDEHRISLKDSHGGDWSEWPVDLRVREFPRQEPTLA